MTNKEINRESGRIFGALLPPNWAFRSQEDQEDYGIDGEIEITTADDHATGFIFKVQLKGTEHAEFDGNGQLVYSDCSVERFSYYVNRLKVPMIYVVCDVRAKRCFWTRVQGQPQVEAALKTAVANARQTFTLKFPAARAFAATEACAAAVVEAVASATDTLTLRSLKELPAHVVGQHLAEDPDLAATEGKFRLFAGMASTEAISALLRSGDIEGALRKAKAHFESAVEEPAVRIQVGVLFAHAFAMRERRAKTGDAAFVGARFRLGVADAMLRICRLPKCEPRLRLYVCAYARASRLQVNARIMLALAVSEKVQCRQGETLAGPITTIERIRATARVTRDFHSIQGLLGEALQRKYYSLIPYIVDDWLEVCLPFLHALQLARQDEAAEACAAALWQAVPPSIAVAKSLFDEATAHGLVQMMGLKVAGLATNDPAKAEKFIAQFEQELGGEKPLARRNEIVRTMRELFAGAANEAKQKPSMADARAYFEQQAAALGIDLNDPNDRIAEVVRIGLEDLDPTRVSRNCQHIHLRPEARGVPAEMLGLVTAGFKSITCLKHGHEMQGLKLDEVYAMFARRMPWDDGDELRCENCPDRNPHPADWNWSEEWEIAQAARYAKQHGKKDAS